MKKNILGMEMTEWKHLSGLADPYKLALAEAGVEAGVPPVVEAKAEVAEDDDDPSGVDAAHAQNKAARLIAIKRSMRSLRGKTRNAAEKAATTPAKDRYKATLELAKHRKTFVKEGLDEDILWAVYLEDIGSSAEEFGKLLDIAIESDDEDMAIELIAIEDQLDELLGAIGAGAAKVGQMVGKGAMAVGKTVAKGAMAAGKGLVKGAQAAGGAVKQGFQAGMGGSAPDAGAPPAAPPAGEPPAATQSASAAPAAAATAAAPATAPTGSAGAQTAGNANGGPAAAAGGAPAAQKEPKKIGLLGTLGRGIGKVAKGVAGIGAAGVGAAGRLAGGVKAGVKGEDVEAWEEFIAEEFDMTAEQYVEMFDQAIADDDQDILGNAHQIDEIFAAWRAKKAAAAQEKHAATMKSWQAARDVVAKHGPEKVKAASNRGKAVDAPKPATGTSVYAKKAESVEDIASQIMESSGYAPRAKPSTIKDLMGDQLRFSGYTDEHIARKRS